MKKLLPFLLLAFLSGYALLLSGCDDEEKIEHLNYEEYQLPYRAQLEGEDEQAIIINDIEEFQRIFSAHPELEAIDFDTHTLLAIKGTANYGIGKIKREITRGANKKTRFKITVLLTLQTVMDPWAIAYILPKSNASDITLSVSYE